jgi:hypothetical protein
MTKLFTKLKEEFFKLLPPTIFFFVALHIVVFVRVLMLKGTGVAPSSSISTVVAALILGKAVLLADMLPMINRFPDKPLIYNVAWKTLIYLLAATLIHLPPRTPTATPITARPRRCIQCIWSMRRSRSSAEPIVTRCALRRASSRPSTPSGR